MYYGQSNAGAHVGGAVSGAVTSKGGHTDSEGFLGMNWAGIFAAVLIGSVTAVMTQLAVEHIKEKRKVQKTKEPKTRALSLELPSEKE
jgi:hypothetical protein